MIRVQRTGWNARYRPSKEFHPIVGWSEHDASPLIVHPTTGALVPAASFKTADGETFSGVTRDHQIHFTAAVPGNGWTWRTRRDDGTTHDTPVIAFAIDATGGINPLILDDLMCPSDADHLIPPAS